MLRVHDNFLRQKELNRFLTVNNSKFVVLFSWNLSDFDVDFFTSRANLFENSTWAEIASQERSILVQIDSESYIASDDSQEIVKAVARNSMTAYPAKNMDFLVGSKKKQKPTL